MQWGLLLVTWSAEDTGSLPSTPTPLINFLIFFSPLVNRGVRYMLYKFYISSEFVCEDVGSVLLPTESFSLVLYIR